MVAYLRDTNSLKKLISFKGLKDFNKFDFCNLDVDEEYNFTIQFDDLNFDFKLIIGDLNSLVVFFNSAIPASKSDSMTFPFFTGLRISKQLKSTKIFFCDPLLQLSKKNKAFWYVGSKKLPTQRILIDILSKIKNQYEVKNMIFWGSSGGGFPALLLSNIFKDSVALVNAPTTTLSAHHNPDLVMNIENTLSEYISDEIDSFLDLEKFSSQKNNAIILQNKNDSVFIKYHLKPYLDSKGLVFDNKDILDGYLKVVYRDWGKGHLVAPVFILSNLLRLLEKKDGDFLAEISSLRINTIVNYDVCISDRGRYIEVKILNVEEESTYAVYLCKGTRVVDKIMYQESNIFIFDKKYLAGKYYIRAFTKFKKDSFVVINNSISFIL